MSIAKDESSTRIRRIAEIYRDFLVRFLPLRKHQNDLLDTYGREIDRRKRESIESRIKQSL